MQVSAVILAGGRNSRMQGKDKAFLLIYGEPLIIRTIKKLGKIFTELVVVTNSPEKYSFMYPSPESSPLRGEESKEQSPLIPLLQRGKLKIRIIIDEIKEVGPIGGIYTGLRNISNPAGFVFACDMPGLSIPLIKKMLKSYIPKSSGCLVARDKNRIHPLHAIYPINILPQLKEHIATGNNKIQDVLKTDVNVKYYELNPSESKYLVNVNTVTEWRKYNKSNITHKVNFPCKSV